MWRSSSGSASPFPPNTLEPARLLIKFPDSRILHCDSSRPLNSGAFRPSIPGLSARPPPALFCPFPPLPPLFAKASSALTCMQLHTEMTVTLGPAWRRHAGPFTGQNGCSYTWSSSFSDYLGGLLDDRVDFPGHVALETADDFRFAHSFCGSSLHVLLGPRIVTQPDHNDAIERRVSLAITTAIETMTVGLAG